ncbi:TPA: hypothetical protein VWH77_002082 [Streptococcus pneumoniae]|nr:hypothetical protein [Streptococcus pneumoniae]
MPRRSDTREPIEILGELERSLQTLRGLLEGPSELFELNMELTIAEGMQKNVTQLKKKIERELRQNISEGESVHGAKKENFGSSGRRAIKINTRKYKT